jgi:hypothetical protein
VHWFHDIAKLLVPVMLCLGVGLSLALFYAAKYLPVFGVYVYEIPAAPYVASTLSLLVGLPLILQGLLCIYGLEPPDVAAWFYIISGVFLSVVGIVILCREAIEGKRLRNSRSSANHTGGYGSVLKTELLISFGSPPVTFPIKHPLSINICHSCGNWNSPPTMLCPRCRTDPVEAIQGHLNWRRIMAGSLLLFVLACRTTL